MIRSAIAAAGLMALSAPAIAADFAPNDQGLIEFVMPSANIGCVYVPKGGTSNYMPPGGGPELSCDRVQPAYVRVTLLRKGKAVRYDNVGDASCCGAENTLAYGESWDFDGYSCLSSPAGLTCERGGHGFAMSRKKIRTW